MAEARETIRLEFMPWIARKLGYDGKKWVVLEEGWEEGLTARELLEKLYERYPTFGRAAYERDKGKLGEEVSIVVNGLFLEVSGGLDRALQPGDVLVFLPAFAGGGGAWPPADSAPSLTGISPKRIPLDSSKS